MHFALELAAQHGTPFYVYDLTVLRHRVRHARAAMPAKVLFAVKANPTPELLRALHGEVDGLDVASRGEIETALACGFAGEAPSRTFAIVFGLVYGLVAILGFAGVQTVIDLLHLNDPDNWLHAGIAVLFLAVGLVPRPIKTPVPA